MARATTADDITAEVIRRLEATPNPWLREVTMSLVSLLHAFVKDVELTEAEWFEGIRFLTDTGHMCDDKRQEFILLSDTLGVSMVVDLITHRRRDGATESTVFGPFHRDGAPELPLGGNIAPRDAAPRFVDGAARDGGATRLRARCSTCGRRIRLDSTIRRRPLLLICTCAALFARTKTVATSFARFDRSTIRFHPTARSDAYCAPPGGIPGARRTSTSSCRRTATSRSPRISSTQSIRT
jgi:hypothetical protein